MKSFSEIRFDIVEVLTKDDPAGKWISDFMKSDAPQFAGKSEKKKKQMALAAYYAKQNESKEAEVEEPEEEEKKEESVLKKAKKKEAEEKDCSCDEEVELDEAMTPQQKSDFDRMMAGAMSRAAYNAKWKKPLKSDDKVIYGKNVKEEAENVEEGSLPPSPTPKWSPEQLAKKEQKRKENAKVSMQLKKEKQGVKEGWDEMMKAVKDKAKPQPNGGAGKKQGSRYGGTKQKDEPVKEGLKPEHNLRPGWMLKKDPELAKKIEAKTKAYKALAKYAGKKIEKKD